MAVKITKVFKRSQRFFDKETLDLFKKGQSPFDFPGLRLVESVEASKAINEIRGSAIIMAGSGMITGGRIKHHLIRNITRPESTLLFVGYQAAGTLGRRILEGRPEVRIHGQSYPVKMRLEQIEGFSAHAGKNDLIRWLDHFKHPPGRVFLTHGEEKAILSLSGLLRSKGDWKVEAPGYQEEFEL
jgi:metallo-beta-lactamase family protein